MKFIPSSLLAISLFSTIAWSESPCFPAYKAGNYPAAEQCLKKELKKERSWDNLFGLGYSLNAQQRYKEALPYLLEAEQKSSSIDDYMSIYSTLGSVYNNLGDREKEYFYSMKYLDMTLKSGDNESIATAYNNLASYFHDYQPQKALEYYEKSLEYREEFQKAIVYDNLASLYGNKLKNPTKSEEMRFKAIVLSEQTGNYNKLGLYKTNLGVFYYNHERYAEAKSVFNEALPIIRKVGLRESEATILKALELLKNK